MTLRDCPKKYVALIVQCGLPANLSQVAKKLVRGDFKSGRVKDPTAPISSKHEKTVKNYVKDFMDKAAKKKVEREKDKVARNGSKASGKGATMSSGGSTIGSSRGEVKVEKAASDDGMLGLSDNEDEKDVEISSTESSAADLKRKREDNGEPSSPKKTRTEVPPVPPPPPPPPVEDMPPELLESSLTPFEDDPTVIHSAREGGMGSVTVNGKMKLVLDNVASPMQLATPPTNGTYEHNEYSDGSNSSNKRTVVVNGGT